MAEKSRPPARAPKGLGAGGAKLWRDVARDFDLLPEQLVQLEEACRAKDRLDELDSIIHGKGVLKLMQFRLSESFDEDGPYARVEVKFDNVLTTANATANLLKQLLAALRLPDEEGRRPQRRGARGAQKPTIPGGAATTSSAASKARSRWGAAAV